MSLHPCRFDFWSGAAPAARFRKHIWDRWGAVFLVPEERLRGRVCGVIVGILMEKQCSINDCSSGARRHHQSAARLRLFSFVRELLHTSGRSCFLMSEFHAVVCWSCVRDFPPFQLMSSDSQEWCCLDYRHDLNVRWFFSGAWHTAAQRL